MQGRFLALRPRAHVAATLFPTYLEIVKVRLSIGLRPEADFARPFESRVLAIQLLLTIQVTLHVVTRHLDFQGVPGVDRHLQALFCFQLDTFAGHNLVEAVVVLQRVHAADVVVVVVLEAPDKTASLIRVTGNRLESHTKLHVRVPAVVHDTDVEDAAGTLGGLGERIACFGRRRIVRDDFPDTAFALAGLLGLPAGRHLADILSGKAEAPRYGVGSPKSRARQPQNGYHLDPSHRWVSLKQREKIDPRLTKPSSRPIFLWLGQRRQLDCTDGAAARNASQLDSAAMGGANALGDTQA